MAENAALRAQAARSASLQAQHAQLLERLRGARGAAQAASVQRDAALADAGALQERVGELFVHALSLAPPAGSTTRLGVHVLGSLRARRNA